MSARKSPSEIAHKRGWWGSGVLYQVYVRSFQDTDGDGVGDIPGVISRLDHLSSLGVEGLWLSPTMPSPNADWGYDVSDYTDVEPAFGSLGDLDALVRDCSRRGIHVLLDLVPNHTSDRHPWFADACSSRTARHREWYVWADPGPGGSPPNNWISAFGTGPAWTRHAATGQYYLHNFLPQQPDLNWWNPQVRASFEDIIRFWFDRGVAGFRIDVAHALVKDRHLRDNPVASHEDHPTVQAHGQRLVYNMNRPETHEIMRSWRALADSYDPPRVLLGETYVFALEAMAAFYGSGTDELHLAQNFPFAFSELGPEPLSLIVAQTEAALPETAWPVWFGSNHDVGRFPTRWCDGDPDKTRCGLMLLLTLRGTPILYYGDEIGMTDVSLPRDLVVDPAGTLRGPDARGRDPGRTPMQWDGSEKGGFTEPGVTPWLPAGDVRNCNVASQEDDAGSILTLCRTLIALRRARPDLSEGGYSARPSPRSTWCYRRGAATAVALNLSDAPAAVELAGTVLADTRMEAVGTAVADPELPPWTGVVIDLR